MVKALVSAAAQAAAGIEDPVKQGTGAAPRAVSALRIAT